MLAVRNHDEVVPFAYNRNPPAAEIGSVGTFQVLTTEVDGPLHRVTTASHHAIMLSAGLRILRNSSLEVLVNS